MFVVKHIKSVDGLSGCYRGLSPKLLGSVVSVIGTKKVADKLGLVEIPENDDKDKEYSEEEK